MVVQEYLDGKGSLRDLSAKHNIPSSETLLKWVNSYNSHEELKDYNPKGEVNMTKSRKTTLEERNRNILNQKQKLLLRTYLQEISMQLSQMRNGLQM